MFNPSASWVNCDGVTSIQRWTCCATIPSLQPPQTASASRCLRTYLAIAAENVGLPGEDARGDTR